MMPEAPQLRPIVLPLARLRRKVRLIASAQGLAKLLTLTGALVLSAGFLDYLVHLPAGIRMTLFMALGVYVAYGIVAWIVRPLFAPLSIDTMAAKVEEHNPWLQDRLRSALSFGESSATGSRAMQESVISEMLRGIGAVKTGGITNTRRLGRWAAYLLIPLALLSALLAWQPALFRTGLMRLVSPLGDARWPKAVRIEVIGKVPSRFPVGQRLELMARLAQGDRADRQVIVNWKIGQQPTQRQIMQRNADGTYSVAIDVRLGADAEAAEMQLWIEAGDDILGPSRIVLVPRLEVRSVALQVKPPAYTRLPEETDNLRQQSASAPAGSGLSLAINFSRGVEDVTLDPVRTSEQVAPPEVSWSRQGQDTFIANWTAAKSFRFRITAHDDNGYTNQAAEEFEIIVRPDQLPTIQLETPRKSEERTAESILPLSAVAEDDYGIAALALEARMLAIGTAPASRPSTGPAAVVLPLVENGAGADKDTTVTRLESESRRQRLRISYPWKLMTFPSSLLRPGDVIEFQLAATDNFALNGQTHPAVRTPALRITIISQDQLLQRSYDELRQVASQLDELRTRQDRLRADTADLQQQINAKPSPDKSDEAIAARIAEQQVRAASQAKEAGNRLAAIARRLEENASPNKTLRDTIEAAGKTVANTAENQMKPSAGNVKQGADREAPKDRRESALKDAQDQQRKASEQLAQALDALGDVGGVGRAIDMLNDLLNRQQKVSEQTGNFARDNAGKRPEDLPAEQKDRLDKLSGEQKHLAEKTDEALEQLRNMSQRQAANDKASAEAMRQAAQTGQEQSVSQHQQRASEAMSQNQSGQASQSQQSAEAGLQQMLESLKDAQRKKLEQLVRQLANIQQQLELLVRRQAGHNLDNLLLRHVDQGENAPLTAELTKKAADNPTGRASSAEQLAASQQQTHRNTTDIAEQMDKVRGANEAAADVGRAASRMERAVSLLRQGTLDAALNPPQTEALAALESAVNRVKKLQKQSEQQNEQDKFEQLRKAYEEVRQQQKQLNDTTRLVDEALAGGKRRRSDLVRLNQLSADQQRLSDGIRPLSDQLRDLGSDVFARVSRETGVDMGRVAAMLSQQKTGKPAQMGQQQIMVRLDSIIRALMPEKPPKESKYETPQPNSDSGSQAGKKPRKLPPAAELALIRDLQQLVNSQTTQTAPQDADVLPEISRQQSSVRLSLDQLIRKVAPEAKLPDDKASREVVPEENAPAPDTNVDELDAELLSSPPPGQEENPDIQLMARRMSRSAIRLGEQKDPGPITQVIQQRILKTLDKIIEESKKNQDQQQQQQQQSQQSKPQSSSPSQQNPSQNSSQSAKQSQAPAASSKAPNGKGQSGQPGDIRETAKEWGGISQRDRQAIIESTGENIIEKYRKMTEEYYQALSNKAAEKK